MRARHNIRLSVRRRLKQRTRCADESNARHQSLLADRPEIAEVFSPTQPGFLPNVDEDDFEPKMCPTSLETISLMKEAACRQRLLGVIIIESVASRA
jgi:hypothetical protein